MIGHQIPLLRYTKTLGTGWLRLQALVETGAAREFRGLREGDDWRLEL